VASVEHVEVLRVFVEAHEVPYPRRGGREPILVIHTSQGELLKHHALGPDAPDIDTALLQELAGRGWITVDDSRSTWQVIPTPAARALVEQHDRIMNLEPVADVQPLLEVIAAQAQSPAKLSWAAVRPILLALREYWEAGGFSAHGIQFPAVLNELPAEHEGMLGATVRQLIDGEYLSATSDFVVNGVPGEVELTEKTHTVLDGWPGAGPDALGENLIAALLAAADQEPDPVRKRRFTQVAETVRELGVRTAGEVLGKVLTGGI